MSKKNRQQALPGLEVMSLPADLRPAAEDMSDPKRFTAGVLFRDFPEVFKSAATMLVKYGDSEVKVAEILRLSTHTVRAIRDMITSGASDSDAAAAAFLITRKIRTARRSLKLRALEALGDRLDDCKVAELMSIVEMPDDELKQPKAKSTEVIDVDEFDSEINGLNSKNKNARQNDGEVGVLNPDRFDANDSIHPSESDEIRNRECSTTNESGAIRSFGLSDHTTIYKVISCFGVILGAICSATAGICAESGVKIHPESESSVNCLVVAPSSAGSRNTPSIGGRGYTLLVCAPGQIKMHSIQDICRHK